GKPGPFPSLHDPRVPGKAGPGVSRLDFAGWAERRPPGGIPGHFDTVSPKGAAIHQSQGAGALEKRVDGTEDGGRRCPPSSGGAMKRIWRDVRRGAEYWKKFLFWG